MPEKLAVLCSDIHLSHTPPVARAEESDWYEAMRRPLVEISQLAESEEIPVICGGDVFHKWNSPPKLVNFALEFLPDRFYSVLGQHDLPYHSEGRCKESATWTMVLANRLSLLRNSMSIPCGREFMAVDAYWWGDNIVRMRKDISRLPFLSVIHAYCWMANKRDVSVASKSNSMPVWRRRFEGSSVVLFGDNHKGFMSETSKPVIFNAGTLMRRRIDEKNYAPMVGILWSNGKVEPHYLDISLDRFSFGDVKEEAESALIGMEGFMDDLRELGEKALDFRKTIEKVLRSEGVSKGARTVILDVMEKIDE